MSPFYAFIRGLARLALRVIWRLRIEGADRIPRSGPLIVAGNHVSYFDPPTIGAATSRPLHYMAKEELFALPVLGGLIRRLNAFPVDRSRGDVWAIRRALEILAQGEALLIFPEGGRNLDGQAQAQLGTALLAARSGAPVLPVFVEGTANPRRLARITVRFGEPLHFKAMQKKATKEELANWTDAIMHSIFALGKQNRGLA